MRFRIQSLIRTEFIKALSLCFFLNFSVYSIKSESSEDKPSEQTMHRNEVVAFLLLPIELSATALPVSRSARSSVQQTGVAADQSAILNDADYIYARESLAVGTFLKDFSGLYFPDNLSEQLNHNFGSPESELPYDLSTTLYASVEKKLKVVLRPDGFFEFILITTPQTSESSNELVHSFFQALNSKLSIGEIKLFSGLSESEESPYPGFKQTSVTFDLISDDSPAPREQAALKISEILIENHSVHPSAAPSCKSFL